MEAATACAASGGHLDALVALKEIGCPMADHITDFATDGGHVHVMSYLLKNGYTTRLSTLQSAVESGSFELVKMLLNYGCPTSTRALDIAASAGRVDLIELLRAHNCPWSEYAASIAAEHGHLDTLVYLHKHGCRWDESTFEGAVKSLACLKYVYSNNCPTESRAVACAARGGHIDSLDFLFAQGDDKFRLNVKTWLDIIRARVFNAQVFNYLIEKQCPWDATVCLAAVQAYQFAALKFLRSHGCPWSSDIWREAVMSFRSNDNLITYLFKSNCPIDEETIKFVAVRGYYHIASKMEGILAGEKWT